MNEFEGSWCLQYILTVKQRNIFYLRALNATMMVRMVPPVLPLNCAAFLMNCEKQLSKCCTKILMSTEVAKRRTKKRLKNKNRVALEVNRKIKNFRSPQKMQFISGSEDKWSG